MGLATFWSKLVSGSRVKEIPPQPSPNSGNLGPRVDPNGRQARRYNTDSNVLSHVAPSEPAAVTSQEQKAKSKPRDPTLTKQKSEGNLKRRRSWFGNKPEPEKNIPAVPRLPPIRHERTRHTAQPSTESVTRPGTALTTDDQIPRSRPVTPRVPEEKEKRKSLFGNRKRSQSSLSQTKAKTRQSWAGGRAQAIDAPPIPAMPLTRQFSYEVEPVQVPQNEQMKLLTRTMSRSRTKSEAALKPLRPRTEAAVKPLKKRKSWFAGSGKPANNAEKAHPPLPIVPALMRDDDLDTPDSSVATTRTPDQLNFVDPTIFADSPVRTYGADDSLVRTVTRGNSMKQPRPISGVSLSRRRSNAPREEANGFLQTTDNRRASNRHSLLDDGEGGMMCLSEEQQSEWDKLKRLMEGMERRPDLVAHSDTSEGTDTGVMGMLRELELDDNHQRDRSMFANDEALAALEFGDTR
ncbi:hypothetical protein LTR08_006099 [Meristemomyces frigidus]|nr:hypothetical protein LTR08_006099 [Meristemomyces frigidus]